MGRVYPKTLKTPAKLLSMKSLFLRSRLNMMKKSRNDVSDCSVVGDTSRLLAFFRLSFSAAILLRTALLGSSFGKKAITIAKENKTIAMKIHPKYHAPRFFFFINLIDIFPACFPYQASEDLCS